MSETIVTRFAPSPTGYLHIGGARTALFNWLFARAKGGKMLLRVEDTDRARSTDDAIHAILEGLSWLGLNWDEEPVYQFARAARHREIAERLLAEGNAYRCYASAAELEAMREKARAEGRPPTYDGTWRDCPEGGAPSGVPFVIRFKAPRDGETIVDDKVQGRVVFPNKDLDDLVLLRSDNTPTYNLSVVVDDHDMGITHVIRGVDHLTNAARQSQIYRALGWTLPVFAHVPLIHGPDGAKLSKRHGALGVEAYRAMGYLPVALRNYLVRLGWSHGDDEIISTEEMLKWFELEGIGRSAARFDFAKLESLNAHYLRQAPDAELLQRLRDLVPEMANRKELSEKIGEEGWQKLAAALPGLKARAKTLCDLLGSASYLFATRPLSLDDGARKILDQTGRRALADLLPKLEQISVWNVDGLEACLKAFAEESGLKLGKVAQPLRAALTGRTTSPGIFDVLHVLGKEESIARVRDQALERQSA